MSTRPTTPALHTFQAPAAPTRPDSPGLGCLVVIRGDQRVPTPLRRTTVEVTLDAFSERTEVAHEFVNESRETIECVYVTALPFGAAIDRLTLRVGDRSWNGRVERRDQARATYDAARDQGRRTALLELDEDDVGTLSLGTVRPGESVAIHFAMVRPLALLEGRVEVRIPLVLGTRFTVSGGNVVAGPQALPLGVKPTTDLVIRARIRDLQVEELSCTQHAIVERHMQDEVVVTLARTDEVPDRDFVLRFVPRAPVAALRTLSDARVESEGRAVAAHLALPLELADSRPRRLPRDLVFLVDRSGSMQGPKMDAARRATRIALRSLEEGDRFAVLAFDDVVEAPSAEGYALPQLLPYSQAALDRADAFLGGVDARGGTEIGRALEAGIQALGTPTEGRERALVLLTDGQVQGLDHILQLLGRTPPPVLALGIDDASNAGALLRIANASGGESRWVGPGEDVEAAIEEVVAILDVTRLRSLELWAETAKGERRELTRTQGLCASLRAGAATTVFAFVPGDARELVLAGTREDGTRTRFRTSLDATAAEPGAIGKLWAAATLTHGRGATLSGDEATALALRFGILSREVALVLVGDSVQDGGTQRRIDVAVATPSGWRRAPAGAAPGMPAPAPMACAKAMPRLREECDASELGASVADSARSAAAATPKRAQDTGGRSKDLARELLAGQRADGSFGDGSVRETLAALRTLLAKAADLASPRFMTTLRKARAFLDAARARATPAEATEMKAVLADLAKHLEAAG